MVPTRFNRLLNLHGAEADAVTASPWCCSLANLIPFDELRVRNRFFRAKSAKRIRFTKRALSALLRYLSAMIRAFLILSALVLAVAIATFGFAQRTALTQDEQAISKAMGKLRSTPDADRPQATRQIALEIRKLPAGEHKVSLADGLANLSTEGDFGHNTLQEVATTFWR